MLVHVNECIDCLTIVAGKRILSRKPVTTPLSLSNSTLLVLAVSRQYTNDLSLVQQLYGPSATVEERNRRRVARFEYRLAEIAGSHSLSLSSVSRA